MFPLTKNPVLLGDGRCLLLRILPFVPPIDLPSIVVSIVYVNLLQ